MEALEWDRGGTRGCRSRWSYVTSRRGAGSSVCSRSHAELTATCRSIWEGDAGLPPATSRSDHCVVHLLGTSRTLVPVREHRGAGLGRDIRLWGQHSPPP